MDEGCYSLYEKFRNSEITAVSNSKFQGDFIMEELKAWIRQYSNHY